MCIITIGKKNEKNVKICKVEIEKIVHAKK
jgi:hypothetical protein